jgi:hypothetical protein
MSRPDGVAPEGGGRRLGRRLLVLAVGLAAAAVIVWVLFNHVFPWVDTLIDDPVLGALSASAWTSTASGPVGPITAT